VIYIKQKPENRARFAFFSVFCEEKVEAYKKTGLLPDFFYAFHCVSRTPQGLEIISSILRVLFFAFHQSSVSSIAALAKSGPR
jgi:hypothetical protein